MWRVIVLATLIAPVAAAQPMDDLFIMHDDAQTRWASGENPSAGKGAGGTSNQGAKGAAFQPIRAGDSVTLMETEGAGVVHRMWITIRAFCFHERILGAPPDSVLSLSPPRPNRRCQRNPAHADRAQAASRLDLICQIQTSMIQKMRIDETS